MMEFDVVPDICSCMVPWVTLHNFIILSSANQSAQALRRKTIKELAEFKQQYEKGRGDQYWRSHIDTCPIFDRIKSLKNLQSPKEKPKYNGVIGIDMVSLRQMKRPQKNSTSKFSGKLLRNTKAVIEAAFRNFLKKRTPGEKTSLKSFKEKFNLPFNEQVIDAKLNEILKDDSFAEYFSPQVNEREAESIRPSKKRRLEENPTTQDSTVDEISLNQGTINERDYAENEPCSAVTSVLEERCVDVNFPSEEKTLPKCPETTEFFLPSPISEEDASSPLTPDKIVSPDNKEPLHDEPVENSILAEVEEQAVCVGVPYHTQRYEMVHFEEVEERERRTPAPAEFLLPVELVDTPPESVCLESLSLVEEVKESVLESPGGKEAIVEDENCVCLSDNELESVGGEEAIVQNDNSVCLSENELKSVGGEEVTVEDENLVCLSENEFESVVCGGEEAIVEDENSLCLSENELDEMMVLDKRAEIQSHTANMKNLATDDVILPPTPPHTYDLIPSESKEPINLDDSGIVVSESVCVNNYQLETFGSSEDIDIINSILTGEGGYETHTFSQKPIESFGNTHVNSNYSESCALISKPNIPKRIIFSPSTDIFHMMGRTAAETMYEPDIQPNQNVLPVDWENYFN